MTEEPSELTQVVHELIGLEVPCWHGSVNCSYSPMTEGDKRMIIGQTAGASVQIEPHDGGIPDETGKKFWVFVSCPDCGYDSTWKKILHEIDREARNPGSQER